MSRFISEKAVCALTSLSRATIRRKVEAGTFPSPYSLGERKVNSKGQLTGRIAWDEAEVLEWNAERKRLGRIVRLESRP